MFTEDVIYMMANISSLVNVYWFMGIPFNDTSNFRLAIAEKGQAILGDYLSGLQVGNEPDLYAKHERRPSVRFRNRSPLKPIIKLSVLFRPIPQPTMALISV